MSLRLKLVALLTAALLFIAGLGAYAVHLQFTFARTLAVKEAESVAQVIGAMITLPAHGGPPGALFEHDDHLQTFTLLLHQVQHRHIVVVDTGKVILADTAPHNIGTVFDQAPGDEVARTMADARPRTFVERSPDHPDGIDLITVPLRNPKGTIIGAIVLEYTPLLASVIAAGRRSATFVVAWTAVTVLLMLGVGLLIVRRMMAGLGALNTGVARVAGGDMDGHIELASRDELGRLAEAFNTMTERLRSSRSQVLAAREFTDNVVDSCGEGIMVVDREGAITLANPAAVTMTGLPAGSLVGQHLRSVIVQGEPEHDPRPWNESPVHRTLSHGDAQHLIEARLRRREDDGLVPVVMNCSPLYENAAIAGAVLAFSDISTLRLAQESAERQALELLKANRRLGRRSREHASLARLSSLLQCCLTFEEAFSIIGETAPDLFPETAGAFYLINSSRNLAEAVSEWGSLPADRETVFAPGDCWALRGGREHLVAEGTAAIRCKHTPASPGLASLCVPLIAQGEALGVLYLAAAGTDAVDRLGGDGDLQLIRTTADTIALAFANLRLRETLQHQSIRDPLTGLFNRRYLEETLDRELRRAERHGSSVGMILFDIDHFKRCNDTFGHAAGDHVLRELGLLLREDTRESDIGCRFGGEEFVVLLPDVVLSETARRAGQLRESVKGLQLMHQGRSLGVVTISCGLAVFPGHGRTAEELLLAADRALYRAKAEGRDRVVAAEAPATDGFVREAI